MEQALPPQGEWVQALIAVGSNQATRWGDAEATVRAAISTLLDLEGNLLSVSAFYQTPCFPAGAGPDFVNAAAVLETPLSSDSLLAALHGIEADFGRERVQRWGPRTLDLDLIAYGSDVLPNRQVHQIWRDLPADQQGIQTPDQLILPHPRMQDRAFVLVPLAEIAPGWKHPIIGRTIRQMRDALTPADIRAVKPLN